MQNAPTAFPVEPLTGLAAGAAPGLPAWKGRGPQLSPPGRGSPVPAEALAPRGVTRAEPGLWAITARKTLWETALHGTSLSAKCHHPAAFPTFVSN